MENKWCNIAEIRREQIENDLDLTFSKIFIPYFTKKIYEISPDNVLEIGSGTGHLAKNIKGYTLSYVAIEPSLNMFRISKEVLQDADNVNILNIGFEYLSHEKKYQLILCHLCIQTISNMGMFFEKLNNLLGIEGRAIFTLPHPCFYNSYKKFFSDEEYNYNKNLYKEVSFSITNDPEHLISNIPYYHRPISDYINAISSAKLTILSFDEIYPSNEVEVLYNIPWNVPRYCSFTVCKK